MYSKIHYGIDNPDTHKLAMLGSTQTLGQWDAARAVLGHQSPRDPGMPT